jgi:hypothetical protein
MLDIRIPIGLMFSILGIILGVYGIVSHFSNPEIYKIHSFGVNVNLAWGCVLLAFGIFMLMLVYVAGKRSKKSDGPK